jgi:hypothetical protein
MVDSVTGQGEDYAVVGRCGLYCGGCPVYLGGRGDEDARSHAINEWNVPAEKIRCNGCQGLTPECFGNECILLPCLESKGYVYCSECAESHDGSCEKFGRTSNYLEDLGESAEGNLKRVQAGEAQEWLKEQEKRWSCPDCGSPFFWEATNCPRCGKALE